MPLGGVGFAVGGEDGGWRGRRERRRRGGGAGGGFGLEGDHGHNALRILCVCVR